METEKLKKALIYANQNPTSEFAIELRKRIQTGTYNKELGSLGVNTSSFKVTEKPGLLKRIGSALTKSERSFGSSIAGAILPFTKAQKEVDDARIRQEQTVQQIVDKINETKASGGDATKWENALKAVTGNDIISDTELNPALNKTNKQVLGEALGVFTDIAGAGTFSKAGLFGANKFTSGLAKTAIPNIVGGATAKTANTFIRGAVKGASEGALAGAAFGTGQGVARGLQDNMGAGGVAISGISGGLTGGALGGIVGGLTGGISGTLRGRAARKQELKQLLESSPTDSRVAKYTQNAKGKIQTDKVAQEAIKQGFDEADVSVVKSASKTDKEAFAKMFDVAERASTNKKVLDRPTDVVGSTFIDQVKFVAEKGNAEAKKLDTVAQSLKGKVVNQKNILGKIYDDISRIGAYFDEKGQLAFDGSDFEGLKSQQNIIKNVYQRILRAKDGLDLHRIKRFIDNNVDYGKSAEGLTGEAQRLLKGWRSVIDQTLDARFAKYNSVNETISTSLQLMDEINSTIGRKFKIGDNFANLKAGAVMRRLLGNSSNRADILNLINTVQQVSEKFGKKIDSDIISQVVFADMLEDLFGTQATAGLQGQVQRGVEKAVGTGGEIAGAFSKSIPAGLIKSAQAGINVTRNVNQEAKITALKKLLGI